MVRGKDGRAVCDVHTATVVIDGVPLYALHKHTRSGREAIRRFAQANHAVKACLEEHVPSKRRNDAAYMAAFYTDASSLALRFSWSQSVSLEALGTEADFMKAGVPSRGDRPASAGVPPEPSTP